MDEGGYPSNSLGKNPLKIGTTSVFPLHFNQWLQNMHNLKLAYSPSTSGAAGNSGKRHSKATEADSSRGSRAERERGNFEAADTLGRKERRPLTSVPSGGVGVGVGAALWDS